LIVVEKIREATIQSSDLSQETALDSKPSPQH
jgi:hypothetical protein